MFFPLGDDNSRRKSFPFVTILIIGINAFVWYLQLTLGDSFTNGYSVVPRELFTGSDIIGRETIVSGIHKIPLDLYQGPTPIYLTILTSMFMHGSWMHIIGNMLYLFIFGDQIEDLLGRFRYIFFYLTCGIVASLLHAYGDLNSIIPSLGASGAIAGVLGGYLVYQPKNLVKVIFIRQIIYLPAYIVLGSWFLLQVISQISPVESEAGGGGVAYLAHIGGFIAGIFLMPLLRKR